MKRLKILTILLLATITLTSCFRRDVLEDVNIYTTVYPIKYVTDYLYGEHSTVESIYPAGTDISKYKLNKKQLKDYSSGAIFVYNGLGDEKNIAKDLLNDNRDLKIIDVSQGLEYENSMSELWLDPSNYLMLANNIKTGLENYIDSKVLLSDINSNYARLKLLISSYDAELETMTKNIEDNNIVIASDSLAFLKKYNLTITNVDDTYYDVPNTTVSKAKRLITNGTVKYVYMLDEQEKSEIVKELENAGAKVLTIKSMTTLSEEDISNKEDYESLMRKNIDSIKKELFEE